MRGFKNKKAVAWIVMLVFLFTCVMPSGTALAGVTETNAQIVRQGEISYYLEGEIGSSRNNDVQVSKMITATENENEFDIELKVITKENLQELTTLKKEAAVVLIMDTSKSMQWDDNGAGYCVECGKHFDNAQSHSCRVAGSGDGVYANQGTNENPMRITTAVNAANSFIEDFAANFTDSAMISLVTFNYKAVAKNFYGNYWLDLAEGDNVNTITDYVDSLDDYNPNLAANKRTTALDSGTNIAASLQVAYNLLNDLDENAPTKRYVILLTDGAPNRNIGTVISDYEIADEKNSSKYYTEATEKAGLLKNKATVYSVGFSKDVANDINFLKGLATSEAHYSYMIL